IYLPTLKIPTGWDGDQTTCRAGTLSAEYKEAIRTQTNYFRAMAGVPSSIVFKEEYNAAAQAAALITHAHGFLSHEPPPTSLCYTTTGSEGAGSSNLHIHFGASLLFSPIESYIEDEGPSNAAVGHRRWLLLTDQRVMGTGSVDSRPSEGL